MVKWIYFISAYNHRMQPLPLGKEILLAFSISTYIYIYIYIYTNIYIYIYIMNQVAAVGWENPHITVTPSWLPSPCPCLDFFRSSHQICFCRAKKTEKVFEFSRKNHKENTCRLEYLFWNLLKKRLWHSCFPVNFTKFLGTPFLQNTSWSFSYHIFLLIFFSYPVPSFHLLCSYS